MSPCPVACQRAEAESTPLHLILEFSDLTVYIRATFSIAGARPATRCEEDQRFQQMASCPLAYYSALPFGAAEKLSMIANANTV